MTTYNDRVRAMAENMAECSHNDKYRGKDYATYQEWKITMTNSGYDGIVESELRPFIPIAILAIAEQAEAYKVGYNAAGKDEDSRGRADKQLMEFNLLNEGLIGPQNEEQ